MVDIVDADHSPNDGKLPIEEAKSLFDKDFLDEGLAEAAADLSGRTAELLHDIRSNPDFRSQFWQLKIADIVNGKREPDSDSDYGTRDYYVKHLDIWGLAGVVDNDDNLAKVEQALAARRAFGALVKPILDPLAEPSPDEVVRAFDVITVFRAQKAATVTVQSQGQYDSTTGAVWGVYRAIGVSNRSLVSAIDGTLVRLPDEDKQQFVDDVLGAFGRMATTMDNVAAINRNGARTTIVMLADYLSGRKSSLQSEIASPPLRDADIFRQGVNDIARSELLAKYWRERDVEVDRYSLDDITGLESLSEIVDDFAGRLEAGQTIPKPKFNRLQPDVTDMIYKTLVASGTDYGQKLAAELERAKTPLRDQGTNAKVLPFASIVSLANKFLPVINQSPKFKDETIEILREGSIESLPEAFRRLMFIASHGSEGNDLPEELDIETRFRIVDTFAEIAPAILEKDRKARAEKAAGKIAVSSPRGVNPHWGGAWRPGYGVIS